MFFFLMIFVFYMVVVLLISFRGCCVDVHVELAFGLALPCRYEETKVTAGLGRHCQQDPLFPGTTPNA